MDPFTGPLPTFDPTYDIHSIGMDPFADLSGLGTAFGPPDVAAAIARFQTTLFHVLEDSVKQGHYTIHDAVGLRHVGALLELARHYAEQRGI